MRIYLYITIDYILCIMYNSKKLITHDIYIYKLYDNNIYSIMQDIINIYITIDYIQYIIYNIQYNI